MILYGKYDGYKAIHSIINDDDNFFDAVFAVSQTAEKYSLSGNVIKEFCLTEEGRKVLNGYSGFGGLKCILNPAEKDTDIEK